ncbi:MAG: 7-cyano-7-deazaguanine synthase [archaeon]
MNSVVLLASGGLDSYVTAHYIKNKARKIKILFFNYGQKCLEEELFCVKKLAKEIKAELEVIDIKWLGKISTSLINKNKVSGKEEIIKWYVPCRNTIFLSIALAHVESEFLSKSDKYDIYLGIKHEGDIQFNDTTNEFLKRMNKLAEKAIQKGDYKIIAPFLNKDKEEIIELGEKLKLHLENTYSCYLGKGFAKINNKKIPIHCGKCSACLARKKGFKFSSVRDPSIYES